MSIPLGLVSKSCTANLLAFIDWGMQKSFKCSQKSFMKHYYKHVNEKCFKGGSSKEGVVSRKEEGGSSKEEVVLRQFGIVSMAYGICHHDAGVTCETVSVKCKIFSPNFNIVSGFAHQQLPMRPQIIHSRAS